jgi:hypothetical protein
MTVHLTTLDVVERLMRFGLDATGDEHRRTVFHF